MKDIELASNVAEEHIKVALALETLAYYDRNYLAKPFSSDNRVFSEEIQGLLSRALELLERGNRK